MFAKASNMNNILVIEPKDGAKMDKIQLVDSQSIADEVIPEQLESPDKNQPSE